MENNKTIIVKKKTILGNVVRLPLNLAMAAGYLSVMAVATAATLVVDVFETTEIIEE